ncbi:UDP-N-acetylmuramoyl-L-alanyl-D-glutamate--2,6-diaminopimelate ligase [Ihubacter massiliensis]|uniref:UDP-N-acetylmuramoyl-L-alanyl-D-glutamate--2, 6-diaminopimelate ligase n=1 Tax=Hominibacterium faecale TaxID=2839743 RepID=A0A9J6QN31_9FIRM|nr:MULTISPECIES: UDP-N-acetylmuramoyl-L-alanyl-D-glutamate--2,6-diaminopimelate ligase [Eubacteriales Family XIII. Incertae Sedis]MCI7300265.1 UDP-N-acetylmuramoyl-L-alanyl-D-glutamate--2,6-diaminopimelate ligase [Clostridia bacterium]MDE8734373.1 UDP-N-acetylmuramoyl-L-alanyl-D-glutamate--2,6-diaminopimelate ligase [Eubacteriales bacterium DFI.9.88]MDY3010134.1 UDP-N-acetylmuramoyl-L-alanyl-D-glutamate--2,6-diaminopimelate ligase [Clostridiales Family XIII bacterium]MCO7121597.1 UDP-N-acetylmu
MNKVIEVFGITGTNGKTTASCMLRKILEEEGKVCALIGTIEHQIGNKRYVPINTTPGKELLKELFGEISRQKIKDCVMEVSSHGIDQGRIADIRIAYGGFTNLSQDHLDYHKTMENYYQVKKRLFLQCEKGACINLDDRYGKRLFKELHEEVDIPDIKGYSLKDVNADFYGQITEEKLTGSMFSFYEKGHCLGDLKTKVPGRHFVYNAMLAAAMARQAGISFSAIKQGLRQLEKVPGRMELIGEEADTLGVVDYAHTPDGLEKLLSTLALFKRGRLICVFGCGGFRDKGKRPLMGEIAGNYSDYCVITNDNPRGEPPENICQSIEEGLYPTGCDYCILLDRYQAIKRAVSLATKWDIIVVAGKGHETYQLSGDEKLPFDDRKVLKELLENKYEKTYNETD